MRGSPITIFSKSLKTHLTKWSLIKFDLKPKLVESPYYSNEVSRKGIIILGSFQLTSSPGLAFC